MTAMAGVQEADAFERTPPHDLAAEQCVLGGMMLSQAAIVDVIQVIGPADHYRPAHQIIHQVILDLYDRGDPVDAISVAAELTRREDTGRTGGALYLHTLISAVPTAANAGYYAQIVRTRSLLREMIAQGTRLIQMGYSADPDPEQLTEQAILALTARLNGYDGDDDPPGMDEAVITVLNGLDDPASLPDPVWTGYLDLDRLMGGLTPGSLYVVAARPAMGKSTVAVDISRHAAIHKGHRVVFYSLEMPRDKLIEKIICAEAQVNTQSVERRELGHKEWDRIAKAVSERIGPSQFLIQTPLRPTPNGMRRYLRKLVRQGTPADLLVVDYLQLVHPDPGAGGRDRGREQEVATMSREFKEIAREFGIPVILVAQLNRGPEQRADKRPAMSDLRESGSVEQDADAVILLFREDAYDKESPRAGEIDFIVAKNRYGRTDTITMAAQLHFGRMADMARS